MIINIKSTSNQRSVDVRKASLQSFHLFLKWLFLRRAEAKENLCSRFPIPASSTPCQATRQNNTTKAASNPTHQHTTKSPPTPSPKTVALPSDLISLTTHNLRNLPSKDQLSSACTLDRLEIFLSSKKWYYFPMKPRLILLQSREGSSPDKVEHKDWSAFNGVELNQTNTIGLNDFIIRDFSTR